MANYQKIVKCGPELRVAFQGHIEALPDVLLASGLLTEDNVSQVANNSESEPKRSTNLLSLIRNKVRLSEKNYNVFVNALKNPSNHGQYKDILQILDENITPQEVIISAAANNGSVQTTQSGAQRAAASNGLNGEIEEKPRFNEADLRETLTDKEPQSTPADRRAEMESYLSKIVVLLHTVKVEELVAVYKYLKPPMNGFENAVQFRVNERMAFVLGKFGNHDVALLQTEKSGECYNDIHAALDLLKNVQLVIGLGFGFGRKEKCNYGDVLVSKVIYGVTTIRIEESGIKLEGGHLRNNMQRVISVFARDPLTHRFESITASDERKPKILADTLFSSPMLVNHPQHVIDILKHDARSIGGEMEGKTVADCVQYYCDKGRTIDVVFIKGVADFGDGTKGKAWQFSASLAAASYAEDRLKKTEGRVYFLPADQKDN